VAGFGSNWYLIGRKCFEEGCFSSSANLKPGSAARNKRTFFSCMVPDYVIQIEKIRMVGTKKKCCPSGSSFFFKMRVAVIFLLWRFTSVYTLSASNK
jgi:hypothetical protein